MLGHIVVLHLIFRAKTWKQPKCPLTDEWIKKVWYIYTKEYHSAIKKDKIMLFAETCTQLDILILSKVSQKEKDKYYMISHTLNLYIAQGSIFNIL